MVDLLVSHDTDPMTAMNWIPESLPMSGDDLDELIVRVKNGCLHGVQELLKAVRIPENFKHEIFRLAVKLNNLSIVEELLNHGCKVVDKKCKDFRNNPLSIAVSHGDFEMVDLLVSHGADVVIAFCLLPDKLLKSGDDIDRLIAHIRKGKLGKVREALGKVELDEPLGYQMVRLAVVCDHFEIVEELVKHGCKITNKNTTYRSPLELAILIGNLEMADFLVSNGADILIAFCLLPDIVFENGDDVDKLVVNVKQGNLREVTILLNTVELSRCMGYQMVRLAVAYNNFFIVKELLRHGCEVNFENQYHPTPLDIALSHRNHQMVGILQFHGATTFRENQTFPEFLFR
ncbi:hypothetical protein TNCT_324641 [Trichonephila clavata]|uniref:Ankyrin repeat protein n=1 Tax=Trichonephila clavata TaxID=2740835 RepID=A0A8X6KGU7_TRICU|nr:hypothetical protein TNCT_324641 [Trichonephila clavata]